MMKLSRNENQSAAATPQTFSASYRGSIRTAIIWFGILALWCAIVLDIGESLQAFLYALGVYSVTLLLIVLRRPVTPSRLDLLVVGWALPILFFLLLLLIPAIRHTRGVL
jgi:hypothetical protein